MEGVDQITKMPCLVGRSYHDQYSALATMSRPYGYKSHDPGKKITHRQAVKFARTMSRIQKGGKERRQLFEEHPVLERYENLAKFLRHQHEQKKRDGADSGLIAHIGKLMDWPVRRDEWGRYLWNQTKQKGERPRSNQDLGVRADEEIRKIIRGDRVLARDTHRYTKWFLMYMYERGWLPCDSQLPIWPPGEDTTVSTWADVLCYDINEKRFVLIELKTGYAFRYREALTLVDGRMDDSPYNRHQMQLGWMHYQLDRILKDISPNPLQSFVIRVNSADGVPEPFPLDEIVRKYFFDVYDTLDEWDLDRFAQKRKKRKV